MITKRPGLKMVQIPFHSAFSQAFIMCQKSTTDSFFNVLNYSVLLAEEFMITCLFNIFSSLSFQFSTFHHRLQLFDKLTPLSDHFPFKRKIKQINKAEGDDITIAKLSLVVIF
jgi:hypothetical protein